MGHGLGRLRLLAFILLLGAPLGLLAPAEALADPCTAIPDSGAIPASLAFGSTFSGPVVQVLDGDSLCVAVGPRAGADWVEVRLADFFAPEMSEPGGRAAKQALQRIAGGQRATCVASLGTHDRIAARCSINGRPIGELMRAANIAEGGRASGRAVAVGAQAGRSSAPTLAPQGAFFNCAEARAAGPVPVRRGTPGYNPKLDGDNDGLACEPVRSRTTARPRIAAKP